MPSFFSARLWWSGGDGGYAVTPAGTCLAKSFRPQATTVPSFFSARLW